MAEPLRVGLVGAGPWAKTVHAPGLADHPGTTAERLTDAVLEAGVASLVMFTLRFAVETREWLDDVTATGGWTGGGMRWLSGALLDGMYHESRWRHEEGALADVGPHVIDLLDAALGPVTEVLGAHGSDDGPELVRSDDGQSS